jgi:hypothetical protein
LSISLHMAHEKLPQAFLWQSHTLSVIRG